MTEADELELLKLQEEEYQYQKQKQIRAKPPEPGVMEQVGDGIMTVLNTVDSYTGAPVRSAIGAAQDGMNPIAAGWNQVGEHPEKAPTGQQLVRKAGVSDRPIYDVSDEQFDELMMTDPTLARDLGALRGVSRSGAAGLALDVAADPTNFIPGKQIAKGVAVAGKAVDGAKVAAGRGLKSLAETSAFKSSGAMLKDFRTAADRGRVKELGRYMLDNKVVRSGDSVNEVARRAQELKKAAGEKLDKVYTAAAEKFSDAINKVGFDPKRDKAEVLAAAAKELGNTEGAETALNRLSKYLDEVAVRHGDKPNDLAKAKYSAEVNEYLPKQKQYTRDRREYRQAVGKAGDDPNQPALSGLVDDLQRTTSRARQVEVNGPDASVMRPAPSEPLMNQPFLPDLPTAESETARIFADETTPFWETVRNRGSRTGDALAESAQKDFLNQNSAEQISLFGRQGEILGTESVPRKFTEVQTPAVVASKGQLKIPIFPEKPPRPVKPGDVRNPMAPRGTNDVKSALDRAINYSRNPLTKEPAAETAFSAARQTISRKVDEAIESLGGDALLEELKAANKQYGNATQIEGIAADRVNRNTANQMFGLTDTIVGGAAATASATAGGPAAILTAGATATTSKLVRTYGASTIAVAADRVSKYLLRSKPVQELAKAQPQVYKAVVINMTRRVLEKAEPMRAVADKSGPGELDTNSSRSSNFQDREAKSEPAPKKGREKWMDDGLKKLESHGDGDVSQFKEELMKSEKGKQLLIAASDLKPGSKAMEKIAKQITTEFGKGRN